MTIWLISGSRDFPDEKLARAVFRNQFQPGDTIYHGGARGVDTWAEEEAEKLKCRIVVFEADWTKGKQAGVLRNKEMFTKWSKLHTHMSTKCALVMWNGTSRGTRNMLTHLTNSGCPIILIQVKYKAEYKA